VRSFTEKNNIIYSKDPETTLVNDINDASEVYRKTDEINIKYTNCKRKIIFLHY